MSYYQQDFVLIKYQILNIDYQFQHHQYNYAIRHDKSVDHPHRQNLQSHYPLGTDDLGRQLWSNCSLSTLNC